MRMVNLPCLLLVIAAPVYAVLLDPPGSKVRPGSLRRELHAVYVNKKDTYTIRTHHVNESGVPLYTNRLVQEDSPYLLQHAHNPVDWHAWGAEAFALALRENKPVFLSIGYSTCHWCHVMERESFDNENIARLLNENFISIKVDREQRPDLDEIYMTGVQLMTGHGGWPMSNFLTADGKPFYGGTYYPPGDFTALLNQVNNVWRLRPDDLVKQAEQVSLAINRITSAQKKAVEIDHQVVSEAVSALIARHDPQYGGFGSTIKFPGENSLLLLLNAWQRDGNKLALEAALKSLDGMAAGGIYDQFGGGFHRYSTDRLWLVPHFEKMLYNQAQLARAYSTAYKITGNEAYGRIVQQTLDYVFRDMRSSEGAFYSARDADSQGKEGLFYLWTPRQLADVLTDGEVLLAQDLFGITKAGNFEGSNIPTLKHSLEVYAAKHGLELPSLIEDTVRIRAKMTVAREGRIHPLRDEKIISAWNGMMISSLVLAARELKRQDYLQAAIEAGEEIWSRSWSGDQQLGRIILNGQASVRGGLEDYAYLAEGFLYLFDTTGDEQWKSRATQLAEVMLEKFWDKGHGGFFLAEVHPLEPSIARPKSPSDGAIASGNSVALNLLVRLFQRTGELRYRQAIAETINAFSGLIKTSPSTFPYMLLGVDDYNEGSLDSVQFSRSGHVRVVAGRDESGGFTLDLLISPGWHINAHEVNQVDLTATRVEIPGDAWLLDEISYPPGVQRDLGFQETPLNLYEDQVVISGLIKHSGIGPLPLGLHLQACSDEFCLPPERLNFRLFGVAVRGG